MQLLHEQSTPGGFGYDCCFVAICYSLFLYKEKLTKWSGLKAQFIFDKKHLCKHIGHISIFQNALCASSGNAMGIFLVIALLVLCLVCGDGWAGVGWKYVGHMLEMLCDIFGTCWKCIGKKLQTFTCLEMRGTYIGDMMEIHRT